MPQKGSLDFALIRAREENEERSQIDSHVIEEEEAESPLMFRFPTYEEFVGKQNEESHLSTDQVSNSDSDDEFFDAVSAEDEAVIANSSVHVERIREPLIDSETARSDDTSVIVEGTGESDPPITSEAENSQMNVGDDYVCSDVAENSEVRIQDEEKPSQSMNDSARNGHLFSDDDESLVSDSDSDSLVSSSKFSFRSSLIDSLSDGFLSDIDFEKAFEVDSMAFDGEVPYSSKKVFTEEDMELENLNKGYETDDFEDEDEDILKELKNLETENDANEERKVEDQQPSPPKRRVSFAEPLLEDKQNDEKPFSGEQNNEKRNSGEQQGEKPSSGEPLSSDSEEQNELERQWEHQDLVEQLKMEIKKVRAIGLPTILEESESPKITEDFKPWKIEEKFHHEDTIDELDQFYKSYRERMRKLDILNYQKMYAMGFLRQKDPLQAFTRNKISTPAVAAIVSLHCWSCKGKSSTEVDQPMMRKFSKELESDLELVYVGQMCLSWEFLRWQYGKALKLWDSDLRGSRRYNEVADKFQQFQVLLTRFLEDEPFQGPRVQHYVKTRCVLRNLLQVPVIREDNLRDKKKERKWVSSKDAITSVKLVETIEESIRILWQFIRSDRGSHNAVLNKCRRGSNVELQNPADTVLLEEIRSTLQKKEKRLKELRKSENCILRKIQKHHHLEDNGSDHELYFFSQVDMKLVSRVLNMSKITTEQLVWCSDKLSKINVVGGKLYVEPCFLLFPC